MSDRAQDTEAIRAARDPFANDVLERLVASNMGYQRSHGHYIVPLAQRLLATRLERDRLVARLEAAERALGFYADPLTYFGVGVIGDEPTGGFMEDIDEVPWPDGGTNWKPGKRARAALAAAAPGETTINKPNEWTAHNIPGPEFEYRESAAPGETEQTP